MKRWIPLFVIAGLAGFGWWLRPDPATQEATESVAPYQTELVLPASQDTFVAQGIDDPVGHLGQLQTGFDSVEHFTYIQWDLPEDLGADATVTHVEIQLYCTNLKVSQPAPPQRTLEGGIPNKSWDENRLTWRTVTGKVGPLWRWEPGGCDFEPPATGVWKTMSSDDIPELLDVVQGWVDNADDNNGIMLVPVNKNPEFDLLWDYRSSDNELPPPLGKGPKLTVRIEGAVTPTFTPSITPTPSDTPTPTNTFTPTATFTPSATPTPTFTPSPTATPSPTPTYPSIYAPLVMKSYEFGVEPPTQEPGEPSATPEPAETPDPGEPTLTPEVTPEPDVEIELQPLNDSGVEGTAALFGLNEETVEVALGAAPMLEGAHPAAIHDAESCDELGDELWELSDVVDGGSTTTLSDSTLEDVADGSNAVVLFMSGADMSPIACGILPAYTAP